MNHVSDLRTRTACGIILKELKKEDRALAAFTKETIALVDCPTCKNVVTTNGNE